MIDYQKLKRLAEAATQGDWLHEGGDLFFKDAEGYTRHLMETCEGQDIAIGHDSNLKFIAAANPAAVLALIAQVERLERKNDNQAQTIREYSDLVMGGDVSLGMLRADIRVTAGERDQLRAEVEALTEKYEAARDRKNSITLLQMQRDRLLDALHVLVSGSGSSPGANKKYAEARAAIGFVTEHMSRNSK